MPRPQTKDELLKLSQQNFAKLNDLIDSYSSDDQNAEFPIGTMNRNIRDVLAHIHHWHLMTLEWYEIGMKGQKPEMPAKGYTWKTMPELNRKILEKYQSLKLEQARKYLLQSYQQMQKLINGHTDEELFEKKRYTWTGTTSMGSYLISATASHYDWAFKLIRKAKK